MATSVTSGSTYSRKANPYGKNRQSNNSIVHSLIPYLARPASTLSDKVEGFKFPEALQKFHYLLFIQVRGQSSDEDLVDRIRDIRADHAWNVSAGSDRFRTAIIFGPTDLEGTIYENDAIERHSCCSIFCRPEL